MRVALSTVALFLALAAIPGRAQEPPPFAFQLPIPEGGCGGFDWDDGHLFIFQYEGRNLFKVSPAGTLIPHENVSGWYVVDVAIIDGIPIYCSRDRVFRKVRGKIEVNPVPDSEKLISITADNREVFLLDAPPKNTIIVLNKRTSREVRRVHYDGRNPVDLVEGEGYLWVLDKGDRCIHRVSKETGRTDLRIQAGPGVQGWTHGLVFRDGDLYVHEADFARLRRVDWREEEHAVWSWSRPLRMTFVQESWNVHERNATAVSFRVPIPPSRATQTVGEPEWSQKPRIVRDDFGQAVALFDGIRIPPGGEHILSYSVDITPRAVQYDPPLLPLTALDEIDDEIRNSYLATNSLYLTDAAPIRQAAAAARKDARGDEPRDVRTLIENITRYVVDHMAYRMDDSWNDALTVLDDQTGSCSEYSFLFSSLCRLNNIPTRLVGGLQIGDYGVQHETKGFHRWTEVYYPQLGWIPVDVTKIDSAGGALDYEFLFGTPGYLLVLSEGDFDEDVLGKAYYIWRNYRGGKRTRNNFVTIEPLPDPDQGEIVTLRK